MFDYDANMYPIRTNISITFLDVCLKCMMNYTFLYAIFVVNFHIVIIRPDYANTWQRRHPSHTYDRRTTDGRANGRSNGRADGRASGRTARTRERASGRAGGRASERTDVGVSPNVGASSGPKNIFANMPVPGKAIVDGLPPVDDEEDEAADDVSEEDDIMDRIRSLGEVTPTGAIPEAVDIE